MKKISIMVILTLLANTTYSIDNKDIIGEAKFMGTCIFSYITVLGGYYTYKTIGDKAIWDDLHRASEEITDPANDQTGSDAIRNNKNSCDKNLIFFSIITSLSAVASFFLIKDLFTSENNTPTETQS